MRPTTQSATSTPRGTNLQQKRGTIGKTLGYPGGGAMANYNKDPRTGKLLPKPGGATSAKAKKAAKEASRELAAMVGELLPADYTGQVPAGADMTLIRGPQFALPGGRIEAERGTRTGKLSKTNRQLEWKNAINWAVKNYATSTVERGAALRAIAIAQVHKAVLGDKDAVAEIANRLDGKAVQQIEMQSVEDRTITIIHKTE